MPAPPACMGIPLSRVPRAHWCGTFTRPLTSHLLPVFDARPFGWTVSNYRRLVGARARDSDGAGAGRRRARPAETRHPAVAWPSDGVPPVRVLPVLRQIDSSTKLVACACWEGIHWVEYKSLVFPVYFGGDHIGLKRLKEQHRIVRSKIRPISSGNVFVYHTTERYFFIPL